MLFTNLQSLSSALNEVSTTFFLDSMFFDSAPADDGACIDMVNFYAQRLAPMPNMPEPVTSLELHGAAYNCIEKNLNKKGERLDVDITFADDLRNIRSPSNQPPPIFFLFPLFADLTSDLHFRLGRNLQKRGHISEARHHLRVSSSPFIEDSDLHEVYARLALPHVFDSFKNQALTLSKFRHEVRAAREGGEWGRCGVV